MSKRTIILGTVLLGAFILSGCSGGTGPGPAPVVSEKVAPAADFLPTPKPTSLPMPTFTPGPKTLSRNRLLYLRSGRFWVSNADGSGQRQLFGEDAPQVYAPPRDPGRAWVSPSGQKLVYLAGGRGDLWGSDISGKNNRRLLSSLLPPDDYSTPKVREEIVRKIVAQNMAWSPNEDQLAFLAAPNGNYDLFIVTWPTGQVMQVTQDALREDKLVWSPDGSRLVYTSVDDRFANQTAHVVGRDGKLVTDLPTDKIMARVGQEPGKPLAEIGGLDWLDNRTLFFYPGTAHGSIGIWKFDLTTGDVQPLTQMPVARPEWSPQARRWVFSKQGDSGRLWVLSADGGEPKVVAEGGARAPLWSPDGTQLVYSKDTPGKVTGWDIHIVGADGSGDRELVTNVVMIQDEPPEPGPWGKRYWTEDGRGLIFSAVGADYGGPGPNLENWWRVSLDTGELRMLTDLERVFYFQPVVLSPDKQSMAFVAFVYRDKVQHLYTFSRDGGNVIHVDAGVRWFQWLN